MRICLATRTSAPRFIPLALLYLESMLVQRGGFGAAQIHVVDLPPGTDANTIAEHILATDPDVVGLSCYIWNARALLDAATIVKARRPATTVVIGGPEVGPVASTVMAAHPAVDVVVKGEGEVPFLEIVEAWAANRSLAHVRGIWWREGGTAVENPDAEIVRDLEEYPSPHLAPDVSYSGRSVCIETQRGCVFRCNFCFYNKDYSIRNRRFDLARVKQELGRWLDADVGEIYLMDPVFNLNASRAKEICEFIAARNTKGIPVHAEVWAEFIDDELAGLMAEANFRFLEVGLQTTDATALATAERRFAMQKFLEGIGHLKRHRIPFELQLIFGLPGETMQSFRRSLDFAMSLDPPGLAVFHLMVLPGTELWRRAREMHLAYDPEPPYRIRSHMTMSEHEIEAGRRMVRAAKLLQRSRAIRFLSREPGLSFSALTDLWLAWEDANPAYREELEPFVEHVCRERGVPRDFYVGFAALEARGRVAVA